MCWRMVDTCEVNVQQEGVGRGRDRGSGQCVPANFALLMEFSAFYAHRCVQAMAEECFPCGKLSGRVSCESFPGNADLSPTQGGPPSLGNVP
jgi:hypothetical protein